MARNRLPDTDTVKVPEIPVEPTRKVEPTQCAVLVVDMQSDFVQPDGALHVEAAAETVPRIAGLLTQARAYGVPVAYTRDTHREGDREFDIWPRHCVAGTPGWKIVDALAPERGDLVVNKNRYDGFYATPLEHYLSHIWDIKQLIIVGTVANICVGQTAAAAGLRWYEVITPADAISSMTDFDQASALRQISFLYNGCVVETVDDIRFD